MRIPWMAVIGFLIGTLGLIAMIGCTNYSPSFPLLVAAPQPCEGVRLSDGTCVGYLERVSGLDGVAIKRHNSTVAKGSQ